MDNFSNFLPLLSRESYPSYYTLFAKMFKSIDAAILLSEFVQRYRYHKSRNELTELEGNGGDWFDHAQATIEERTGMVDRKFRKALAILTSRGILDTVKCGMPYKKYYRINFKVLNELSKNFCRSDTGRKPVRTQAQNKRSSAEPVRHPETNRRSPVKPLRYPETNRTGTGYRTAQYIEEPKEEDKEDNMSEQSFGLYKYFFEALTKINPKMRPPNPKKWQKEFDRMLKKDGRSEEEIKQVIDFIVHEHENPTSAKFTWSMAIQSPHKLREHFASVWLRMTKKTPQQASNATAEALMKLAKENKSYAEQVSKNLEYKFIYGGAQMMVQSNVVFVRNPSRNLDYVIDYREKPFKELLNHSLIKAGIL